MTLRPACAYSSRASSTLTALLLPLYFKIDDGTTSIRLCQQCSAALLLLLLYFCCTKNWCRCDQNTPLPAKRPHRVRLSKGEFYWFFPAVLENQLCKNPAVCPRPAYAYCCFTAASLLLYLKISCAAATSIRLCQQSFLIAFGLFHRLEPLCDS